MSDRQLIVKIIGDDKSLLRSFTRSSKASKEFGKDLERTARGALAATVSVKGLGRSLAFASSSFLGGAGIVFAFKSIVDEASRVQEETEKTGVVFGRNAQQVQAWSKTLAQSFGVAEGAALEASGRFGNMLRPLGFGQKAAATMSERLVELAADMASFNNTKPDEVLQALSSGLAGQVRPLRQFGVFLSQARIEEEALADGIAKHGQKLSQAQKVQAAYNIILKDTRLQQGDVARNTESLSVAQSKFSAGIKDLESRLGTALLPTLTKYVNKAAEWLNQTENQERIQRIFTDAVKKTSAFVDALASSFKSIVGTVRPLVEELGGLKNVLLGIAAVKIASVSAGWLSNIAALGSASEKSAGKVSALRLALLKLGAVGVVAVGVEVILNHNKIEKSIDDFFRSHHLGFAATTKINIPVGFSLADAEKTRAQIEKIGGNSIMLEFLDALIAKLKNTSKAAAETTTALTKVGSDVPRVADDILSGGLASGVAATSSRGGISAAQRNQFFDAAVGRLQDRVQDISSLQGQIKALQRIGQLISERIAKTKDITRRLNLEDELLQNARDIKATQAELSQNVRDAAAQRLANKLSKQQAQQFRALGLSASGDDIIPGIKNLQKRLNALTDKLTGAGSFTDKLRSQFANIRKVLASEWGKATPETRAKIDEYFKTVSASIKKGTDDLKGPLTKTTSLAQSLGSHLFNGLNLDRDTQRNLTARLSRFNSGGLALAGGVQLSASQQPIVIHNVLEVDSRPVARATNTFNAKRRARNPTPRRGRR